MRQVRHMRSSTFEMKSLHNRNSHVDHSNLIHGSTQIRCVDFNWFKRRSSQGLGSVHEKIDVWTGPYENINFSAWNNVLEAASSIQADEDAELAG